MTIELISPLDMHLHLREKEMLANVARCSSRNFAGGVIMPNLVSPVDTLHKVHTYKTEIQKSCNGDQYEPYMTLFFRNYTKEELLEAKNHIIGIKLYPSGITTGSEKGVSDFSNIEQTLSHMEELKIPLLVHGESHGFVLDRERDFLNQYKYFAENFPKLHIIMEHITTAEAVHFVDKYPNLSATVTLHHLLITLDDVIGGLMKPDLFCKPIAKTPKDQACLREAVFSGHDKIMFGSDSAPHPRHKKECCGCAAGIFSAPVALPLLVELFEDADHLELLQGFVHDKSCKRYGIHPKKKIVTLIEKEWRVPELVENVKPFYAGKKLRYQVINRND